MSHLLLEVAIRTRHRTTPDIPPAATYDAVSGYWMLDGKALIRTPGCRLGGPSSKKNDMETGEDQKGQ